MEVVEKVKSKPGLLDTVRNLLDRSCPLLVDANCIALLVTRVSVSAGSQYGMVADPLLPGV